MNTIKYLVGLGMATCLVASVGASEVSMEKIDGDFPLKKDSRVETEDMTAFETDEKATYRVKEGERLSKTLERWVDLVGYDLVWQPDPAEGDLKMASSMEFRDDFAGAARSLFKIVREQSQFDAQIHPNQVLRVFVGNG